MKRGVGPPVALVLAAVVAAQGHAQPPNDVVAFKSNVARIEAGANRGFGFIVGLGLSELFIATAWHTLRDSDVDSVGVCFPQPSEICRHGTIAYIADPIGSLPGLDLAILRVPYPAGLFWRPDALAERPQAGQPVWFIGRSGDWYIPNDPGRTTGFDGHKRLLSYASLQVAEGVSGAPILTRRGIVAMHVESVGDGGEARGVDVEAIRERVVGGLRASWALVQSAQCDDQEVQRSVLDGREIAVHFDGKRPTTGLNAVARLNCLGARAFPRPEWDAPWPGNGVRYGSGDLRAARAVQSVFADGGRLDTRLDPNTAGVAVWIR